MQLEIILENLLEQPLEVIVNTWNRHIIPWWLLLPQWGIRSHQEKSRLCPFSRTWPNRCT